MRSKPVKSSSRAAFMGRNLIDAASALGSICDGDSLFGFSDGRWHMTDAIVALARVVGPSNLVVSSWTAAETDLRILYNRQKEGALLSCCFIVDRSYQQRLPREAALLRQLFGDGAVRVWSGHAKFAILTGGRFDVLYWTSANLNKNLRVENYGAFAGGNVPGEFLSLVEDAFRLQKPGEGFSDVSAGRRLTADVMGPGSVKVDPIVPSRAEAPLAEFTLPSLKLDDLP